MQPSAVDLSYVNAATLLMPDDGNSIILELVGCGGTGSWLAPAIVRIAKIIRDAGKDKIGISFVDPDCVEEKNITRQNFCQAEIGVNKAEALALRYGTSWGFGVSFYKYCVNTWMSGSHKILIGCVDNARARREIARLVKQSGNWWLDCGNTRDSGQVILGGGRDILKSKLPGYVSTLPLPSEVHPELLKDDPVIQEAPSCAEIQVQESQGLAINQRMAAEAADYLVRMLITKDLKKRATYIDLQSGSCRSEYILEETK
jgi:PRTRC genetic system ThiF family protein